MTFSPPIESSSASWLRVGCSDSLGVRQNLLNIFAAHQGSVQPCAQNGKTGHQIGDHPDVERTLLARCQNNASGFDLSVEQITTENA
jgi:hypothetical protein